MKYPSHLRPYLIGVNVSGSARHNSEDADVAAYFHHTLYHALLVTAYWQLYFPPFRIEDSTSLGSLSGDEDHSAWDP